MAIRFENIPEYGLERAAALLTRGFSDYFVPIELTAEGLLTMVRQDSVDLYLSRVILEEREPVGVALLARRGWTSRLAAMSIVPNARGRGIGLACVEQLLTEARARADASMTLEVIEQNRPAVGLYEKAGFHRDRRLVGFVGMVQSAEPSAPLLSEDVREVARALITYGPPDLPWQLSGETLANAGPPNIAYRSGASYIALSNPALPTITIRAIVTLPEARRRGSATALVRAAAARHPDKAWRVSPIFPEEFEGLYQKVGMTRDPLSQWQMTVSL
jgi:ribosomal protein S18 acetylase RimI-like enzyme